MRREFNVYGTPAPQGSKRHVGNGVMIESSKKVKPWREAVKWAAKQHGIVCTQGPVSIDIEFYIARPKSAPKRRTMPDRKPDLDKLVRATLDALTDVMAIEDDARVVSLHAHKIYATERNTPGAYIVIEAVDAALAGEAQEVKE